MGQPAVGSRSPEASRWRAVSVRRPFSYLVVASAKTRKSIRSLAASTGSAITKVTSLLGGPHHVGRHRTHVLSRPLEIQARPDRAARDDHGAVRLAPHLRGDAR